MESDVGRALAIDYRERPEADDEAAWQIVREEVLAGRPTMLSGDILYLDYREYKVHFPAHRFVLLGFDDASEKAFIADRIRPSPRRARTAALMPSRNPPEGLSTHNLWGTLPRHRGVGRLPEATRFAIQRVRHAHARFERASGTAAARRAAPRAMARAASRASGARRAAPALGRARRRALAGQLQRPLHREVRQRRRQLPAALRGFLEWAQGLGAGLVPENAGSLARRAADAWTGLSGVLELASGEGASAEVWSRAADEASRIAELESELFASLAASAG